MATPLVIAFANPVLVDKINRLPTGVVAMAIGSPVLLMAWRYIEINRTLVNRDRSRCYHHGSGLDQHGGLGKVTNVDSAVDAGLVNTDGDANTGLRKGRSQGQGGQGH
jgi:hypothetical protein